MVGPRRASEGENSKPSVIASRSKVFADSEENSPKVRIPAHLPPPPKGRTIVVGAGKASAAMAKAVEDAWPGPLSGLVVTRYGHAVPCERIEIVEASRW